MPRWIIEYVYQGEGGKTAVSFSKISAPNEEIARNMAVKRAPFEEFMVTIHPQSDEQYLGSVERQAKIMSGKATDKVSENGEG